MYSLSIFKNPVNTKDTKFLSVNVANRKPVASLMVWIKRRQRPYRAFTPFQWFGMKWWNVALFNVENNFIKSKVTHKSVQSDGVCP